MYVPYEKSSETVHKYKFEKKSETPSPWMHGGGVFYNRIIRWNLLSGCTGEIDINTDEDKAKNIFEKLIKPE